MLTRTEIFANEKHTKEKKQPSGCPNVEKRTCVSYSKGKLMSNITIHRCPHDQKNPYVMINNNLIRDNTLSPECRWLLIYLLSNEEGWNVSVNQLQNHLNGFCGKGKIYKLLKEAISAGYMLLEEYLDGNLKRTRYIVSETPKFKKCFPHPENRYAGSRCAEKQDAASLYSKKDHRNKNNQKKENMSEHPFGRVALYFYEKLKEINPKVKKPNLDKWAQEMHRLAKEGNREEDIVNAIDFVISTHGHPSSNGFCWANIILSPASLRSNFAKIWAQMGTKFEKKVSDPRENKKFSDKLQKQFGNRSDIVFGYNYIEFINGQTSVKKTFSDRDFRELVMNELNKRKLKIEGI